MRHPPLRIKTTDVTEWCDGRDRTIADDLAVEEPLEIRIGDDVLTITMRTPGDDFALAAGFLYSEGIVHNRDDVLRIAVQMARDGGLTLVGFLREGRFVIYSHPHRVR